jgi:hypothetical protein
MNLHFEDTSAAPRQQAITAQVAADMHAQTEALGIQHTNPLMIDGGEFHAQQRETVLWTAKNLKITRLRLLSDPNCAMWDVSYCYGYVKRGAEVIEVNVQLPFNQIPKRGFTSFLVEEAKNARVWAKGLGILDNANISKLC